MNTIAKKTEPQGDLFAAKLAQQPGEPGRAQIEWFERLLRGALTWMTASDILLSVGRPKSDDNKRWLRELAAASEWVISGQKGYKHLDHATAEEIDHSANWLISQGRKMIKRGVAQRRNAHKIFG